jgi:nucleoside-diphosphate-sugar epimerase
MVNLLQSDLDLIIDHTRDLWDQLRGERLFLTGGTGFFGSWIVESFLWANKRLDLKARVSVLSRQPDNFIHKNPHLALEENLSLLQGDVRTFSFPTGKFSHIIHAATEASAKLNQEKPGVMLETIMAGTRRTLEFADHCSAKKFLFTSSGAIYGKQPQAMTHIPEEYIGSLNPLDPKSAYGLGKLISEHFCAVHAQSSNLDILITRCFAFVGPNLPLNTHFAIGNFINDGLVGGPIQIKGDGTPHRSYLYAADLAIWLWTILFKGQALRPYNVGSDQAISIADLAECVAQQFPTKISVQQAEKGSSPAPVDQYIPSIQRVRHELGLSPITPLPTAISSTISFEKCRHCRSFLILYYL